MGQKSEHGDTAAEKEAAIKKTETKHPESKKGKSKRKKRLEELKAWGKTHPRKVVVLLLCLIVVATLAAGGARATYLRMQPDDVATAPVEPEKKKEKKKKVEPPATIPRRIDGLVVARADANRLPICVMIENAAFGGVRPQSGLQHANVVYEVVVEGGITRLMAVFAGDMPGIIGPIRSARDTYLEFASEYNCPYVHAGGSFTALQALRNFGMRDVDALKQGQYFYRDSSKVPVHNLFGRGDRVRESGSGHGWTDQDPTYAPWKFTEQKLISGGDVANTIHIGFGGSYDVQYRYNATEGYYERLNGGTEHRDANSGKVLNTRNIVIQRVGAGIPVEGKGRVNWPVTGEGEVIIVRNGVATKGRWKKEKREARTIFVDAAGNEIPLAAGNTWVEIVPEDKGVTIQ